MVPGMTERERLAAYTRRLVWLADATLGPARIGCGHDAPPASDKPRPSLPVGHWRRGLSSARVLGLRIRLMQPTPGSALSGFSVAPTRQTALGET